MERKGAFVVQFSGTVVSRKEPNTTGGVAQLGEHLPCKQGVMGSIPIISTKWDRGRATTHRKGLIAQVVRARA